MGARPRESKREERKGRGRGEEKEEARAKRNKSKEKEQGSSDRKENKRELQTGINPIVHKGLYVCVLVEEEIVVLAVLSRSAGEIVSDFIALNTHVPRDPIEGNVMTSFDVKVSLAEEVG